MDNLTIKDTLIDNIVENSSYSKEVVEQVIAFQGEDMLKAFKEYRQIEISGFGLLYVAKGKLSKRIERYSKYLVGDAPRTEDHQKEVEKLLEFLKTKQCQS